MQARNEKSPERKAPGSEVGAGKTTASSFSQQPIVVNLVRARQQYNCRARCLDACVCIYCACSVCNVAPCECTGRCDHE